LNNVSKNVFAFNKMTLFWLILADAGVSIDVDKLKTIVTAAGIDDIESIYFTIFAKAFEGKNILDLITNVSSGIGASTHAPAVGGAAAAASGSDATPVQEKKDEKEEESDEDMGFGLFD